MSTRSLFARLVAILATLALACVGLQMSASASAPSTDAASVPDAQIVRFAAGTAASDREAILSDAGAVELSSVPQLRMYAVTVDAAGADALRADPRVESLEADRVRAVEGTPDDPAYDQQWALPKIGWDQAYGVVHPSGSATVAVLDTGVNASDDLATKLVPGASMLAGADDTADPNGHGTAMASIVAAKADNGVGSAGVAYAGVSVMPVKVLGADGTGQDSDIVAGVVYAADHGADVILMSFSNPGRSDALQAAVDYAWSKGAVLVAATGNDGGSAATYPAGTAKVVGVSATTQDDTLWSGSNFGADTFLGAPGVDIASGSGSLTGTSTSAAIVAGAAALVKANDTSASNGVVIGRLARTADAAGTAAETGNGRVNLSRALSDTSTGEVVPQGVAGDGGPFVGPYVVASFKASLEGKSSPGAASDPWITGNLLNWSELQQIPLRVSLTGGPTASPQQITIDMPRYKVSGSLQKPGFLDLHGFSVAAGTTMTTPVVTGLTTDTWHYTFSVTISGSTGEVDFFTSMRAGAHDFGGSSLALSGNPVSPLQIHIPNPGPGSPDLVLTKSALTAASPGQSMTYTVTYRNAATGTGTTNQAAGVQLTDVLPAGMTYEPGSCTGGCSAIGNNLTWNLPAVSAGSALVTLTYRATIDAGVANNTALVNNAEIFSSSTDANPDDNHASVTTTVFTAPSISGTVINDQDADGVVDTGEPGLAGASVTLYRDANSNGTFDGAPTDPQVGSSVVTTSSGEWAFTGLTKPNTYFVVRTNPATYASTAAIAENVSTDLSTATAPTSDRIKVVFVSTAGSSSSQGNYFLAKLARQNQTIAFTQPTPAAYGSTFDVNPTASSGLLVTLVATGGCSAAPATPGPGWTVTMTSGTTDCVLTANQAGDSNWNPAPEVARTVSPTRRAITVTADAKSQVYGAASKPLTYQVTSGSLAAGDAFTGALSRAPGSNVGSYAIGQNTLGLNSNYDLTYVGANYVITAKPITVTAVTDTKVYDATTSSDQTPTITGGLEAGDTANFAQHYATATIGTGKTLSPTGSVTDGNSGNNYDVTFVDNTTGVITARAITVTADAKSQVYGAASKPLTYQVTSGSLAAGDAFTGALSRAPGSNVGSYAIGQNTLGLNSNYDLTYVGANYVITAKPITVTAVTDTKVYDATTSSDQTPTITGGLEAGDTANFAQHYATATIGTGKTLSPTGSVTDGNSGNNYDVTFVDNTTGVITARAITVTADAKSQVYGAASKPLTYQVTSGSLAAGDAFTGALSRAPGSNVGSYAIGQNTLGLNSNYDLTYVGANYVITAKPITVTAVTDTKVYDATTSSDQTPTITGGLEAGDTANFAQHYATATIGTGKTLSPTGSVTDGNSGNNYDVTFVDNTTGVITARAITVTADAKSQVYGAASKPLTYQVTSGSLAAGDAFTGALSRAPGSNVGSYAIGQNTLGLNSNYDLTYVGANYVITAKPITVTAVTDTKVYDATTSSDQTPTITGGLEAGDTANFAQHYATATIGTGKTLSPTGSVTDGNSGNNYDVTFVDNTTGVITARAITVTADAKSQVYGAASKPLTYQVTSGSLAAGDAFTGALSRAPGSNVGSYAIGQNTLGLNSNYDLTYVGANYVITAKPITVTAVTDTKVYDATTSSDQTPTITGGLEAGDTANFAQHYATATIGTGKTLSPTGSVTDGNSGNNYDVTFVDNTTGVITARAITVTADAKSQVYGAASKPLTYQVTSGSLAAGDAFTGALSRAPGSNVGSYAIGQNTLGLNSNYDLTYVGANYVITAKPITVTAVTDTKVYDATTSSDQTPTVTGGLEAGDTANFAQHYATATIGTGKTLSPTGSVTDGNSGNNYDVTFVDNTTGVITARAITVTADAKSQVYGAASKPLTYQITSGSLAAGDAFTGALSRAPGSNVGSYAIGQNTLGLNSNYDLTYVGANYVITAKPITVTADAKSQVYGATALPLTYQVTTGSLVGGDSFTGALSRAPGSNVGTYAIGQNTLSAGSNYTLSYVGAAYVITVRPITVTALTDTKIYDGTTSSTKIPAISGGVASGDTANFTESFGTASVGTGKTLTPTGSVTDGNSGNNYTVTFINSTTGVITARPITIKANNVTKTYGDVYTFGGTEFTISAGSMAASESIASVTLTSAGAAAGATVAGSPYSIVASNPVFGSGSASNYNVSYANGLMTVTPRDANVAYIGQTTFVSSGSSSTTAQVTLTASVADPDGSGTVAAGTVTFTDLLTGKVLASGVKVSPVANSTSNTGTATTTVTLSTGQYGAQQYLIEVTLGGSYRNTQQTGAAPGSPAYEAAHPVVTVMIPPTAYSTQGAGSLTTLSSAAGTYADATQAQYTLGMKYNSKGTSPQGQIQLILHRADGIYYIKSNSISSLAFSGATGGQPAKDVTIYTKASIYKIVNGVQTSIDGGVTLRLDAHEGCTSSPNCGASSGDTIGVTVLSSKTSALYYSNNWLYDALTKSWRTLPEAVTAPNGTAVVIN